MDDENKLRFSDFERLNTFLNRNVLTYEDLYNSYVKVILDIGRNPNYMEYSELDFQVKMLIDEIKVPLNRIIDFARLKYGTVKDLLTGCLLRIPQMTEEDAMEVVQKLLSKGEGYIVVKFMGIDEESSQEYLIHIDINLPEQELVKNLKEGFGKIDMNQIKQGKVIGAGIGFKKL